MIFASVAVLILYLLSAGIGSRAEFFEEQSTSFKLNKNGSWEHIQALKSNGQPPEQYKQKMKHQERKK